MKILIFIKCKTNILKHHGIFSFLKNNPTETRRAKKDETNLFVPSLVLFP